MIEWSKNMDHEALQNLWRELADWSQATFGSDEQRGPVGPLKHLVKEVEDELLADGKDPKNVEELADVQILLLDAVRRAGWTMHQLFAVAYSKLQVCKTRSYPRPAGDEVTEHIRAPGETGQALSMKEVAEAINAGPPPLRRDVAWEESVENELDQLAAERRRWLKQLRSDASDD